MIDFPYLSIGEFLEMKLVKLTFLLLLISMVLGLHLKYPKIAAEEELICRGDTSVKAGVLNQASKKLTKDEWDNNPERKKIYESKCNCPGITAYSDNPRLPTKYMQCCLRNNSICPKDKHEGAYHLINLASMEIDKKNCKNAPDWSTGNKKRTNGGYLYRGFDSFWSINGKKLEGNDLKKIITNNATWKYLAFTSFSADVKRAAGYSHYGKQITDLTYLVRLKGSSEMKGLFIEDCSYYPKEKEFLFNKGACFKVSNNIKEEEIEYEYDCQPNKPKCIPKGKSKYMVLDIIHIECPASVDFES